MIDIDIVYACMHAQCMHYIYIHCTCTSIAYTCEGPFDSVVDKPAVVATLVATDVRTWSFD